MMATTAYRIRPMTRAEVELAVDWAAAEGWNPGRHDADAFHAADPEGFLVGELDGEPIACISVVRYGDTFGFLGFYIVRPEYRGRGYGWRIWQAGMARLAGRNVGLDGVVAQQDNYRKSGFKLAYRNVRQEGRSGGEVPADPGLVELAALPFATVAAYDRPFFPADRTVFLKRWLEQPGSVALGIRRQDRLAGYGMIRPCRRGYKIGPLFADRPELAETLCRALAARVSPGEPVYLDTPEANAAAVALARLFGVTTFELG